MLLSIVMIIFFVFYISYKENLLKFLILPLISWSLIMADIKIESTVPYPKLLDMFILRYQAASFSTILSVFGSIYYLVYSHPNFGVLRVSNSGINEIDSDDIPFFKEGRNYLIYSCLISLINILLRLTISNI